MVDLFCKLYFLLDFWDIVNVIFNFLIMSYISCFLIFSQHAFICIKKNAIFG